MASQSKEDNILRLILENSPFKEWRFEEIVRQAKVTRAVANKWLKKYVSERLVKRVKEKGRFPYYKAGSENPVYNSLKRIYALEQLHKSGLIPKLLTIDKAKTIILFGSMAKGDWYKDSDIDIFIFGKLPDFDRKVYESRLKRNIELHIFENKEEILAVKTGLIKNIVNGYVLKGQIQDFAEVA
jgi:predicted nucleotidyltransferase